MKTTTTQDLLERLGACEKAVMWVGDRDAATAWAECPRGDWMLWAAARAGVDRRLLVRAAAACARLVLHMVVPGEERPRKAIEAAEAWAEEPTEDRRRAAAAASAAAAAAEAAYVAVARSMHKRCADAVRSIIPCPEVPRETS